MENSDDIRLIVKIAQLYYEQDMTQAQIARELGIYRTTISRLLKRGRDQGIVTIAINYDYNGNLWLEQQVKQKFGLKDVVVVSGNGVEFYSKALRQTAIQATIELAQKPIVLIGGCTGSGKTLLVQQQPNGVDLEGLARHRGSAFGRTLQPQLSQASFENLLAAEMLKTDAHQDLRLWVLEDESRMIGSNHLPECLRERMTQATIAVVEDPFEIRLERLNEEYFLRMHHDFTHAYGDEQGWQEYCEYLHHGLSAIKRRLGLQRYNELAARLDAALTTQLTTGSTDGHLAWLVPLLEEYYDPMYRYQLEKKAEKVVFHGEWAEVAEWVKTQ